MLVCALAGVLLLPQSSQARTADSDRDGLANRFEKRQSHTNPRKADTDGDKLGDRYELRRAHTNPRKRDTDRDRLSDGFEVNGSKTSPRRKDTDRDGLSDGYEVKRSKTSPRRKDTDGDGLSDGYEVKQSEHLAAPRRRRWRRHPGRRGGALRPGPELRARRRGAGEPDPDPGPPDDPAPPDDPPPPADPTIPEDPDNVAPNTSLGRAGPAGPSPRGSATFSFSPRRSPGRGSSAGSTEACGTRAPRRRASRRSRRARTRSTCAPGRGRQRDASPAQRTWTIDFPPLPDIIPPNTSLGTGGPHGTVTTGSASFTFSSSESGSTFQCRLDSGAWGACASPKAYSGLGEGVHNFYVRAATRRATST